MWQGLMRQFHQLRYSLTSRLLVLFLIVALLLTSLVLFTVFRGMKHHFHTQVRPMMVHYINLIANDIGTPPDLLKAKQMTANAPINIYIVHKGEIWRSNNSNLSAQELENKFGHKPIKIKPRKFHNLPKPPLLFGNKPHRLRISKDELFFHIHKNEHDFYFEISRLRSKRIASNTLYLLGATLLAGFCIVLFSAYRILKPIKAIDSGVNAFAKGDFSQRIDKTYDDQLGHLVDSVNGMADEIENMLESKRQLLLGISHELRSPIARSKVNLALMPENKQVTALSRDMDIMQNLINELIESERLNSKHAVLNISEFSLHDLIHELLLNDFSDKNIKTNITQGLIYGDAARIKLMLRNIINNAITYSGDNKPPSIELKLTDSTAEIIVSDHGPGIAKEHIAHLTEPFYRADPSRQRKTGGYGLGLYLCRMIASAHHGSLDIHSEINHGTKISITLPRQPKEALI